jgi:hypothetical protein
MTALASALPVALYLGAHTALDLVLYGAAAFRAF